MGHEVVLVRDPGRLRLGRAGVLSVAITILCLSTGAGQEAAMDRVEASLARLPLRFEENRGQTAPEVRFLARGTGYSLFLTAEEAVLALDAEKAVLRLRLLGANRSPPIQGQDELPGRSHYFIGSDPQGWRTEVPAYARVELTQVYPGVDLAFYGRERRLEYDFLVSACADPGVIGLEFEGAEALLLDDEENLLAVLAQGEVVFERPGVYQIVEGRRREVEGRYVLAGNRVFFTLGTYDPELPLVI